MPKVEADLVQGTLDLMILKSLSGGPQHGYGVARWLERVTGDELRGRSRADFCVRQGGHTLNLR